MTLASQVQKETTEHGGSTSSKQKLYLVAFASFGLLIAVQFRNVFPPRAEASSSAPPTSSTETQEDTSPENSAAK